MSLLEKITQDLKAAMKAKDQVSLRGIRAIKAEILIKKTDGSGEDLSSQDEIALLQRLVKQRQDSLTIFNEQSREDLALIEREEIEVISKYLPEQLSDTEVKTITQEVIDAVGATSMKDMGKVMGSVRQKIAGRADNKLVAAVVKELLA